MERVGTTSATVIDEVEQNLARGTTPVLPACGRTAAAGPLAIRMFKILFCSTLVLEQHEIACYSQLMAASPASVFWEELARLRRVGRHRFYSTQVLEPAGPRWDQERAPT